MTDKWNDSLELVRENKNILQTVLLYGTASPLERKSLMGKAWFKKTLENTTCRVPDRFKDYGAESPLDRIPAYKALLQTEADAINDSTLVQEEVAKEVAEGAEPIKCWREVIPITAAESYSVRVVKGETGYYADEVSEAGATPINTEAYTKVDIPIKSYGIRPLITQELIDDALFDVIQREIRKAGFAMENRLNRVCLNEVLTAVTTNTLNPAGPHIAVSDLALARSKVIKANWAACDTVVTHPTAEGYLLQDSNIAYASYMGSTVPLTTGKVPTLMGLKPYTCTATDLASGPVWDDTTAGSDVTAIVFSKNDLAMLRMRQDLVTKRYEDPIHDLVGISLKMRYGVKVINQTAGCKVYHK